MTAADVYKALTKIFPIPAHTLLSEVRNGVGFVRSTTRTADALVVSNYPSRGLWIAGVEIKVYAGDWKRELKDPAKAEAIQQYCHYWYVATPEGLIDPNELPESWGLIEVGKKTSIKVKPTRQEPRPIDLVLLCSILRNFSDTYVPKSMVHDLADEKAKALADHRSRELAELQKAVAEFENASGVSLKNRWEFGEIGKALKVLLDSGLMRHHNQLDELRMRAERVIDCCQQITTALTKSEDVA